MPNGTIFIDDSRIRENWIELDFVDSNLQRRTNWGSNSFSFNGRPRGWTSVFYPRIAAPRIVDDSFPSCGTIESQGYCQCLQVILTLGLDASRQRSRNRTDLFLPHAISTAEPEIHCVACKTPRPPDKPSQMLQVQPTIWLRFRRGFCRSWKEPHWVTVKPQIADSGCEPVTIGLLAGREG